MYSIFRIGFGGDHCGNYNGRTATDFRILVATKYDAYPNAATWKEVYDNKSGNQATKTAYLDINRIDARFVRISVMNTSGTQVRIDEIEIHTSALDVGGKTTICWGIVKKSH